MISRKAAINRDLKLVLRLLFIDTQNTEVGDE